MKTFMRKSSGQTIVFLLLALTVLAFIFLWNVDLHRIIAAKSLSQNAGDSAALAAARWQGSTLNLIGELNLMHALALSAEEDETVDAITNMQARLCFTGPLTALVAAQVAAKNNRIYSNRDFTELLQQHALEAIHYNTPVAGGLLFPEPYPGAWSQYADMLGAIAADGIAAAPDNAQFFNDSSDGHILREPGFYDAVAGQIWCWFYLHPTASQNPVRTMLDEFSGYSWWPPLPEPNPPVFSNSEIFGLGLVSHQIVLGRAISFENLQTGADQQDFDLSSITDEALYATNQNWYFYHPEYWDDWEVMNPDDPEGLPIAGAVKPEYDYTGADVVIRLYSQASRLTPASGDAHDNILWTAAAKPFGYITAEGEQRKRPDEYGLVMPAFRSVRLIPIDAASGSDTGAFDIVWRRHLEEHLPLYVGTGRLEEGCRYCNLIKTFESENFRRRGVEWLLQNHHLCTLSPPAGGRRGGGTRRGH